MHAVEVRTETDELEKVRRQLDRMAFWRLGGFTLADEAHYQGLLAREEALLLSSQVTERR